MIFISYIFSLSWLLLQNDPEAKRILDKLSSTYNTKVAMEQSFKYTIKAPEEKEQNYEGKVTFKTDMYRIQLHEQEIIFDGKDQYTFLKKQNEVQITRPASTEVKFSKKIDYLRVYNSLGILQKEYFSTSSIEVTSYKKGMYFFEITSHHLKEYKTVIIN